MPLCDILIIGAGIAGLSAANILANTNYKILIIDKGPYPEGHQIEPCATNKSLNKLSIPSKLVTNYNGINLVIQSQSVTIKDNKRPYLYIVNKQAIRRFLIEKLQSTKVEILFNVGALKIYKDFVETNHGTITFRHLIGADGSSSIVRKALNLPIQATNAVLFFKTDKINQYPSFHIEPKLFSTGYVFILPYENFSYVGCGVDLREMCIPTIQENFQRWLKCQDIYTPKIELGYMNHDFCGYKFGDIYLIGDAGGFSLGLSGEGLYSALISGQEIARTIISSNYTPKKLLRLIRLKKKQEKIRNLMYNKPTIRNLFLKTISRLMRIEIFSHYLYDVLTQ